VSAETNRRILVIDDNAAIHQDFAKILCDSSGGAAVADAKAAFFGGAPAAKPKGAAFELVSAYQGEEALAKIEASLKDSKRFAMAFVDVRMPPGWDGIETIARLWQVDPDLQAVICTAFADYSRDDMIAKLGQSDRLLILKKPFDPVEVQQLASALTEKWSSMQRERLRIEEAKRSEQEARAYAASLKTINRALETAKASSEAAAAAKSTLLINLSQKIAGSIRSVRDGAETLCSSACSETERLENARVLREKSESLCHVFDDLADYSRIESGELEVERRRCSPSEIAERVVLGLMSRARAKKLELRVDCKDLVPESIETDPARLEQALAHVVENAIRCTETGSVRVVIEHASRGEWEEHEVLFHVIDTGVGIDAEDRGRLFEPFGPCSAGRPEGTHLGLALSKRLCQKLGGDIGFESTPGEGSTFTLRVAAGDLSGVRMVDHPRAPLPSESTEGARTHPSLRDV
jgi:signal transduction histidine kinase